MRHLEPSGSRTGNVRKPAQPGKLAALLQTQVVKALAPNHWQDLLDQTGGVGMSHTQRRQAFEKRKAKLQRTVQRCLGLQAPTPRSVAQALRTVEQATLQEHAAEALVAMRFDG